MAASEPGETRDPRGARATRRLDQAPSARYASPDPGDAGTGRPSVVTPLAQAAIVAAIGATLLFVVGAIVASTAGLLFVSGITGAVIGLLLARTPVLARGSATRLAIGLALAAVVVAGVATWLYARGEGGTLGLLDYLFETFGPLVPGELLVATLGAAWGASAGPIQRS